MTTSLRALGLRVLALTLVTLGTAWPAWGQCDIQSPDPDCNERPVVTLRDSLFTNPNIALFACDRENDFCVGLFLSNQDGVDSQAVFVDSQPAGAIGSHAYLHVVDAPGVICACPGGSGEEQDACARACLNGVRSGIPHESERAICADCGQILINVRAREDVSVDDDDDPSTPPVIEPLAYILVGQARVHKAVDASGDSCSATLVLDEIVPPFDFSFALENDSHGSVTGGCL